MANGKDPAFLFYSSDFLTGTQLFNYEQKGKYITLLCLQHQHGHLAEEDMINICGTYDKHIFKKFLKDDKGLFYNQRLENEVLKRKAYSESRSKNRKGSDISKSYVQHMENENEIISNNKSNSKGAKKIFKKPTIDEVRGFFRSKGYSDEGAQKAFEHYDLADWHNSQGKPVQNWKQTMNTNWLKPEYKIKSKQVTI